MCNDNNNGGNSPSSSCGSLRQLYSNNGKAPASASTDDGTDDDNLDRPDNHDRPNNHDVVMNHQNKDNHRNGGGGHQSKDDTPFSLPFP
jgi:hypothetical protein